MRRNVKVFSIIFICFAFLASNVCYADDFTGNQLDSSWAVTKNKKSFLLPVGKGDDQWIGVDDAPKLLKTPLSGDWTVTTNLVYSNAPTNGRNMTGLVVYKDSANWMILGILNNSSMEVSGLINNVFTQAIGTDPQVYKFMRIDKRTTDAAYPVYYFYAGTDVGDFNLIAKFEDTTGALNNAKYGVMGKDWATSQPGGYVANYDYISDYVLKMRTDNFQHATLDAVWNWQQANGTSTFAVNNGLTLNAASGDDEKVGTDRAPRILRATIPYDWIIDTQIKSNNAPLGGNNQTGLVVFKNSQNWLLFGPKGNNAMEASGVIGNVATGAICTAGSAASYFRIIRTSVGGGATYTFENSTDGLAWSSCGSYSDAANALGGAKYGLLARNGGTTGYAVNYGWFRERLRPVGVIKDINNVSQVAILTGPDGMNHTDQWGFADGDLGHMFQMNGTMSMVFGDNFSQPGQQGIWRRNAMAIINDANPSDGLTISDFIKDANGKAKELVSPITQDDFTMIPTNGIAVNNTMYMHFMSVRHWGAPGHWDANYAKFWTSTDGGNTWTRQDSVEFGADSNFIQVAMYRIGTDIYMWGIPSGGFGPVKLLKVNQDHILDKSYYLFYKGLDGSNNPTWSSNENDAVTVVPAANRELSVMYNAFLGKYIMSTLDVNDYDMVIRESSTPWGPWSDPIVMYSHHMIPAGLYGAFMLPDYVENNGETTYTTLNRFFYPDYSKIYYNVFWFKSKFIKN